MTNPLDSTLGVREDRKFLGYPSEHAVPGTVLDIKDSKVNKTQPPP